MVRSTHESGEDPEAAARRRLLIEAGLVLLVVIVALVFVFKNSQMVEVDLLFDTKHPRLIWVMLGCLVVGFAVGFWVGGPMRNARRRRR